MGGAIEPVSADEARARLAAVEPVGVEEIATGAAGGRVLAEDVLAPEDLPRWPRAMMDGFAIRAADAPGTLRIAGHLTMGRLWPKPLGAGEAVGIATGGVVPDGADAVVPIELAAVAGDAVVVARTEAGKHVMRRGDDLARGAVVAMRGRRLRAQELGALVGLGVARLRVHRRPRVAVLASGGEVVAPAATPAPGQVRDVNTTVQAAQLRRDGCEVVAGGVAPDDTASLAARLAELADGADAVLLSGGSSVGPRDLAPAALAAAGAAIVFHGIEVRPGRPTLFARLGGKPIVGLPGVPTSAHIIYEAFVRVLIARLAGETPRPAPSARATLARSVASTVGREDWVRVRLDAGAAHPLGGGAAFATLLSADGFIVVPAARAGLDAGEAVDVILSE